MSALARNRQPVGDRLFAVDKDIDQRPTNSDHEFVGLIQFDRPGLQGAGWVEVVAPLFISHLRLGPTSIRAQIRQHFVRLLIDCVKGDADGSPGRPTGRNVLQLGFKVGRGKRF